jgi:hypothetical protein
MEVSLSTQRLEVATVTTAPEFRVMDGNKIFGDLRVSKGGAFWRVKGGQQYQHLTWEQIAQLFKQHGVARAVGEYNYTPPPPASFEEF